MLYQRKTALFRQFAIVSSVTLTHYILACFFQWYDARMEESSVVLCLHGRGIVKYFRRNLYDAHHATIPGIFNSFPADVANKRRLG
jgi:hypothetical protein